MDAGISGPPAPQAPCRTPRGPAVRRQREFMPEEKKDTVYWEKRRKNNEAAKKSREKRRLQDAAAEGRLSALLQENAALRAELRRLGTPGHAARPPWGALPCALATASPSCPACLLARGWPGLACPAPGRMGMSLQPALPAGLLGCQALGGHGGPRPQLHPCWELWPPVPLGCPASAAPGVLLTASEGGLSAVGTCPGPGSSPEGLALPSLPHKLRVKSQGLGRAFGGWEVGRGPL